MSNENVFMLFADCVPVKGAARSAIYDLGRRRIVSLASHFLPLLERLEGRTLEDAYATLATESERTALRNLADYLLANELGTWARNRAAFPSISRHPAAAPSRVHNAIVDVRSIRHDFTALFAELDALGCKYVQIRAYTPLLSLEDLDSIAVDALHRSILGLELLIPYDEALYPDDQLLSLVTRRRLISKLIVHAAPSDRVLASTSDEISEAWNRRLIHFRQERITDASHCGEINSRNLSVSTALFTELQSRNGCLSGKIAIDEFGQIKGCPAMKYVAGQFGTTPLAEAVSSPAITSWWSVAKDSIEVCKDCEFRYACTDCRAQLSDPENPLSKPAKCSYDPYLGRWL